MLRLLTVEAPYGILKSLCNVRFETSLEYFVLVGLLHPHNSTPYVQTGLIIAL
jgi:hypothetical protein